MLNLTCRVVFHLCTGKGSDVRPLIAHLQLLDCQNVMALPPDIYPAAYYEIDLTIGIIFALVLQGPGVD